MLPGADGRRHPDVQRAPGAGRPRPDAAHRDGARHRPALQPPVRRASFVLPEAVIEEQRGHAARPRRPQDEQELRQHHSAVRAARQELKKLIVSHRHRLARAGRAEGHRQARRCSSSTRPSPAPSRPRRLRAAFADGIGWGEAKQRAVRAHRRRGRADARAYEALMAQPARDRGASCATARSACASACDAAAWPQLREAVGPARPVDGDPCGRRARRRRQGGAAAVQAVPRGRRPLLLQAASTASACCCRATASTRRAKPASAIAQIRQRWRAGAGRGDAGRGRCDRGRRCRDRGAGRPPPRPSERAAARGVEWSAAVRPRSAQAARSGKPVAPQPGARCGRRRRADPPARNTVVAISRAATHAPPRSAPC